MFAMYSKAGWDYRCEHPARAVAATSAARRADGSRASDTDHLHFHRSGLAQDAEDPFLVPRGALFGDVEAEAVVGEVPVQDRLSERGQTAREEERRERHRAPDEHARLEE